MLSSVFIDRPRLAVVISIVITVAGLVALFQIPIAQFPNIVPPQIAVTASYAGASAEVVEATVAQPIEARVIGVDNMLYMKSTSGNDGSYTLNITFAGGTDPDLNTVKVQNRVGLAEAQLPAEVRAQGISVTKKSSALLQVIALTSPDGRYDQLFLSNYATINVIDQLKRVPGVGDVSLFSPSDYSMKVWLNTERLTSFGLVPGDIASALKAQNIQAAVGRIGAQPALPDQQFQLNIQSKGRLANVEEFGAVVVRANPDGSFVRVRDVARVELAARLSESLGRLDGQPAAVIGIYQSPGSNALDSAQRIGKILEQLKSSFPQGVDYKITYDTTIFVKESIKGVLHTLVEAFVLVVIVVFLFLGSVRATLIPLLAVPVALIGTFAVMLALGYSANTVSLLALVLAIGIGAVEAQLEKDHTLSPAEASRRAMEEITAPIIAITLVLLSVFVPVAFIPGISGELFRQFAVTVAVSMFLSAINALTLSPALCGVLLRPQHGPRRGVMGFVMRSIDRVRDAYGSAVARIVRISVVGLVVVAVCAVGVVGLTKITPTGFLPEDDQGALFVVAQLPGGASVERTSEVIRQAEAIVKEEPAVADYTSAIGLNFIDNYSQSNAAFMVLSFKPFDERKDASLGAPEVIKRLGAKLRQIPGGIVVPLAPPPIVGLGTGGGFAYVVEDLRGGDPKALAQVVRGLMVAANQDPQLNRVFSTFSATNPSIYLDIDRDKAQILGVPLSSVFQALQASLGGYFVNNMNLYGRTWQVQVQAEAADRSSIDDIYRINVRNGKGQMIPLRSLVEVRVVVGPPSLIRYNNLRAVTVQGAPAPGVSSGQALKAMEEVAARTLPPGFAGEWTDTAFQEKRAEGKTGIILGFAVLFAYLFLVGLYESWTIPVPVLLSVSV